MHEEILNLDDNKKAEELIEKILLLEPILSGIRSSLREHEETLQKYKHEILRLMGDSKTAKCKKHTLDKNHVEAKTREYDRLFIDRKIKEKSDTFSKFL